MFHPLSLCANRLSLAAAADFVTAVHDVVDIYSLILSFVVPIVSTPRTIYPTNIASRSVSDLQGRRVSHRFYQKKEY